MAVAINFGDIAHYLENAIKAKDTELADHVIQGQAGQQVTLSNGATITVPANSGGFVADPLISQKHDYKIFTNSGDYLDYQKKEEENANDSILVNIINDGGLQDSTIPIQTYLQMVHIEFYAPEKFREDLQLVFFSLCLDLKAKLDTINSTAVQISTDDQPTFNPKQSLGIDIFTGFFDTSVIIFQGAHLSNSYKLLINNVEIPFSKITLSRGYETTPDLQKRASIKYFQNTSVFQFNVNALFSKSTLIDQLFADTTSSTTINTTYQVALYDSTTITTANPQGTLLMSSSMMLKDCQFVFAYGSIVSWAGTFIPAYTNA